MELMSRFAKRNGVLHALDGVAPAQDPNAAPSTSALGTGASQVGAVAPAPDSWQARTDKQNLMTSANSIVHDGNWQAATDALKPIAPNTQLGAPQAGAGQGSANPALRGGAPAAPYPDAASIRNTSAPVPTPASPYPDAASIRNTPPPISNTPYPEHANAQNFPAPGTPATGPGVAMPGNPKVFQHGANSFSDSAQAPVWGKNTGQPTASADAAMGTLATKYGQAPAGWHGQRLGMTPGLRDGGDLQTGMGGVVPGSGTGDKIPAKYEPGEFVVSNDMLRADPALRGHLRGLREEVLAEKGMTPGQADAKALGVHPGGLRADSGFGGNQLQARPNFTFPGASPEIDPSTIPRNPANMQVANYVPPEATPAPELAAGNAAVEDAAVKGSKFVQGATRAGRIAGRLASTFGPAAAGADVVSHFNDYKLKDPNVDSSAMGTLRAVGQGDWAGAGRSLSKGAIEAGMDLGSTAAGVADLAGYLPGVDHGFATKAYKGMLRNTFGDDLQDNTGGRVLPTAAAPQRVAPTAAAASPASTAETPTPIDLSQRKQLRDVQTIRDGQIADGMQADRLAQDKAGYAQQGAQQAVNNQLGQNWENQKRRWEASVDLNSRATDPGAMAKKTIAAQTLQSLDGQETQGLHDAVGERVATAKNLADLNAHTMTNKTALRGQDMDLEGKRMTNAANMNRMMYDINKDNRDYRRNVSNDQISQAREGAQDFDKHALSMFQRPNEKTGALESDPVEAANYTKFAQEYLNQPDMKTKYPTGLAGVDAADKATLVNLYRAKKIQDATRTSFSPWGSSGNTSERPQDYITNGQTQNGVFQKVLRNANGSVPVDALKYGKDYNRILPNFGPADTTLLPPNLR